MSELKYQLMLNKDMSWVPCYLKSEADKVIAEKEKQAVLLSKALNTISESHKHVVSLARKCNHANYKRCLAMAEKCDYKATIYRMMINVESSKIDSCPYFIKLYSKKKERFAKWHKRWLALAEKFKPNKEAK